MAKTEISRAATAHIPPFGLRLQPDVKVRLEDAAKAAGRSLNAEISARLQQSLDESATAKLHELQRALEQARFATYKAKMDLYIARAAASTVAKLVHPSALSSDPEAAAMTAQFLNGDRQNTLDMLEISLLAMAEVPKTLREGIDSGRIKKVPNDQPTKFGTLVAPAMEKTSKSLVGVLGQLSDDMKMEFFQRPAIAKIFGGLKLEAGLLEDEIAADDAEAALRRVSGSADPGERQKSPPKRRRTK